jgi:predicted nicotinamide N-methyase
MEPFFPEMSAEVIGETRIDTLQIGAHTLKLSRPIAPERLLDLESVADAYAKDQYMPYWATLWPVAVYLSEAILSERWPQGSRGIELGCGLGLPGVAALVAGVAVTFTDYDASALRFAAENARLNGFPGVRTLAVDWRHPPAETFDLILASDLIYEERNVEPLVELFGKMLAPGGVIFAADQSRPHAGQFRAALKRIGFTWIETARSGVNASGMDVSGMVYRIVRGWS